MRANIGRLEIHAFAERQDARQGVFLLPSIEVSSDDWSQELCFEFRWLTGRFVIQGWIADPGIERLL